LGLANRDQAWYQVPPLPDYFLLLSFTMAHRVRTLSRHLTAGKHEQLMGFDGDNRCVLCACGTPLFQSFLSFLFLPFCLSPPRQSLATAILHTTSKDYSVCLSISCVSTDGDLPRSPRLRAQLATQAALKLALPCWSRSQFSPAFSEPPPSDPTAPMAPTTFRPPPRARWRACVLCSAGSV